MIENLNNNFEIYTNNEIIKIENIFNISSNSIMQIKKDGNIEKISNEDKNNSYYYEIKRISQLLIKDIDKNRNFMKNFNKVEKNFKFLSKWLLS